MGFTSDDRQKRVDVAIEQITLEHLVGRLRMLEARQHRPLLQSLPEEAVADIRNMQKRLTQMENLVSELQHIQDMNGHVSVDYYQQLRAIKHVLRKAGLWTDDSTP